MDRDGWHYWTVYYARRLKTSPPVVIRATSHAELEEKIRAYAEDGWRPWMDSE